MEFTHAQARVVEQLRTQRVASWTQLARRLRCSTKTVQRALAKVGYFNSINHNGGFVTLRSVPQFDRHGLWTHDTVHFSRHGNLLDTLKRLVEQAPGGRTMQELEQLVGTRVHNHVSRLVREGKRGRFFLGRQVVYVAADARQQEAQRHVRHQAEAPPVPARDQSDVPPGLDAIRVIRVLVWLLEKPEAGVASVARGLQARGVAVRAEQVRQILDFYGLKKTKR